MTPDAATQHLALERVLAAAPGTVWAMWTDPQHFAAWYGPAGATVTVVTMDVRVGGARLVRMEVETPHGARRMWFAGEHLEVAEPRLLVYSEAMADEDGNVLSAEQAGMPAGHPVTTEVQVELEPVADGTRLVLTHRGIAMGSPGAAGWQMALDKLAARLGPDGP